MNAFTKRGISPISLAIRARSFECVKYLIDNKADIMKALIQNAEYSPIFLSIKMGDV